MRITNNFGAPPSLVAAAQKEFYSKGDSDYSATELMSSPRIKRLREQYEDELETDVSDMIWSLIGTAMHLLLEGVELDDCVKEERLYQVVDEVIISGAIDLQQRTPEGVIITDYKVTKAWSVMREKEEWIEQLNIYKWLVETTKMEKVVGLKICAIIRDWDHFSTGKEGYPQSSIHMVDVPIWDSVKTELYIAKRLALHRESKFNADFGEPLGLCSKEERWERETIYAVKRDGRKTAIKLFNTMEEAMQKAQEEKGYVETRPGESVRCTGNYCGVAKWCDQFQGAKRESN